jgi:peptidoglycan/LPS O-acetylase OafA/YrhL
MAATRLDPDLPKLGGHIPALDGIRGLAILLVLAGHFTAYGGFRAEVAVDRAYHLIAMLGGVGVDLFFVLSGFLITGILVDAKGGDRFFRNFYMRRVLRIFPLYYGALVFFFVVLPWFRAGDPDLDALLAEQGWYWSYLANVRMAFHGWPAFHSIGHFWSLAVEEQFYIVWPLVVFLFRRRSLLVICAACVVASLGFRTLSWWVGYHPMINVLTVNRMDALAAGAFMALLARGPGRMARLTRWAPLLAGVTGGVLLAMILWTHGWVPKMPVYRTVGRSLLALFFAGLLIVAITSPRRTLLGRFFTHRVLIFFGVYSYGIYVIHHPFIIFMQEAGFSVRLVPPLFGSYLPGQMLVHLVATTVCVGLALASYHLYEERFLNLKRYFAYRSSPPAREETSRPATGEPGRETEEC